MISREFVVCRTNKVDSIPNKLVKDVRFWQVATIQELLKFNTNGIDQLVYPKKLTSIFRTEAQNEH